MLNRENSTDLGCPHIVVIDDVEGNRAVVCRHLERYGFDFEAFEGGEAALRAMQVRPPDLVLLDYMMPEMNGVDVLRVMRSNPFLAEIPVIMLTARAEGDAVVEALNAGADDYVTKPIDFEVLKARIASHLAKFNRSDGLRRANASLDERVTLRVLAIDELKSELEREVRQRMALQQENEALRKEIGREPAAPGFHPAGDANWRTTVERIGRTVDALVVAAQAGQPMNRAQLLDLQSQVAKLLAL
ncbi:MAG: response regulator [Sphingomonadales bacterium]|nr:response regulator [Sphingomonadales bacterium]